jgi:two-component sensor histidine kinase
MENDIDLKELDMADRVSKKLLQAILDDNFRNDIQRVSLFFSLIDYYLIAKQYKPAYKYLTYTDSLLTDIHIPRISKALYSLWFRLDTATHDYKAAVYQAVAINKILDTINKADQSKEIQKLQIQFDTKEKESQISFLKQKTVLQSQNLQQAALVKNYTIGGVILLLLIASLLFRQNRLKQRSNSIISTKNRLLESLLDEKEWLLKEVHHRVKNNLHTVICLLESQAAYLENDALKAIENSQHRIYAMSLIHQKLYQSDDIKTIEMDIYLNEFIQYLDDSFGNPDNIRIIRNIDPIKLNAAQAIPVGLIINEAVTNCFKYAFPDKREGVIHVLLTLSDGWINLVIKDNGTGIKNLPATTDDDIGSLGLELIKGLARDLQGELKVDTHLGMTIYVHFPFKNMEIPVRDIQQHNRNTTHQKLSVTA